MDLLIHEDLPGDLNMAVDWWLLKHVEQPVLRFYGWEQPTLTVGYRQQFQVPKILKQLIRRWPCAIRPTGGGYLLHAGELTYSLMIPAHHPLADRGILSFYRLVRDAVIRALPKQCPIQSSSTGNTSTPTNDCLRSPGPHEPVWDGGKWMASAQVRVDEKILQHGSIYYDSRQWPENWQETTPVFLGDYTDCSPGRIRKRMKENLREKMTCPVSHRRINSQEWKQIETMRSQFSVETSGEFPVFRRTELPRRDQQKLT